MAWRTITVDGKRYRWKCRNHVTVQDADGRCVAFVSNATAKGISENGFERGEWKKTSDGMVTPADVARLIQSANQ